MTTQNQLLSRELSSNFRVRFPDCDPFGHLNNARYIDYFQNARQDHLHSFYGFDVFTPGSEREETWVSTKNQIAYLAPAGLMEEVIITTRLIHFTNRTLLVEGLMLDVAESQLKAVIWMEYFVISMRNMRPMIHSEPLMAFFGRAIYTDETIDTDNFDARVKEIKLHYRRERQQN